MSPDEHLRIAQAQHRRESTSVRIKRTCVNENFDVFIPDIEWTLQPMEQFEQERFLVVSERK